jgi:hypothetical protein
MSIVNMNPFRKKGRSTIERFEGFYIPEPNSGCWLWTGALFGSGYGAFKRQHAHRFSWEMHYGPIPEGLLACHKCDVRCCVNPEHLFIGTYSDNANDMVRKGRGNPARGERARTARLTEEQVEAIRLDPRRLRIIGEEYGVDRSYIWKIKRAWHWKHSHAENPEEATRRTRGYAFQAHGETHSKAKLTEKEVLAIRQDERPSRVLGRLYGVSHHTILSIRNRTIWKHL